MYRPWDIAILRPASRMVKRNTFRHLSPTKLRLCSPTFPFCSFKTPSFVDIGMETVILSAQNPVEQSTCDAGAAPPSKKNNLLHFPSKKLEITLDSLVPYINSPCSNRSLKLLPGLFHQSCCMLTNIEKIWNSKKTSTASKILKPLI